MEATILLRHITYVAFVMILVIWIPVPVAAQRQAPAIEVHGEVKDERGAVIVRAKVLDEQFLGSAQYNQRRARTLSPRRSGNRYLSFGCRSRRLRGL